MHPTLLAVVFLVVMAGALACFVTAYRVRRDTPRHLRFALAGTAIDVTGTVAVLLTHRVLGWHVPAHDATVALVHRGCAYLVTVLLVVQAVGGARRWPVHKRLGRPFVVLYALTYALAVAAYAPR
jgi:cell division protein FtsW (lipid II flippase)